MMGTSKDLAAIDLGSEKKKRDNGCFLFRQLQGTMHPVVATISFHGDKS
jgi:hypothetical protein